MVSVLSIDLVRLMFFSQVMETVLESHFALLTVFQSSCCISLIHSSSASMLCQSYYVLSATSSIFNTLIDMRTSEFAPQTLTMRFPDYSIENFGRRSWLSGQGLIFVPSKPQYPRLHSNTDTLQGITRFSESCVRISG